MTIGRKAIGEKGEEINSCFIDEKYVEAIGVVHCVQDNCIAAFSSSTNREYCLEAETCIAAFKLGNGTENLVKRGQL